MVVLYVGGQKVEWADAAKLFAEPSVDLNTVEIRNEATGRIMRFGRVDEEPKPLVVDEQKD